MEDAALKVLANYGVFGFVVVAITVGGLFFGWRIIEYFMAAIKSRDEQMERIINIFNDKMAAITKVIDKISSNQDQMSSNLERFGKEFRGEQENIIEYLDDVSKKIGTNGRGNRYAR